MKNINKNRIKFIILVLILLIFSFLPLFNDFMKEPKYTGACPPDKSEEYCRKHSGPIYLKTNLWNYIAALNGWSSGR